MANQFEIRDRQGRVVSTGFGGMGRQGGGSPYRDGGMGGGGMDSYEREELEGLREVVRNARDEARLVASVVEIRESDKHMLVSLGPGNAVDIHQIKGARVGDRVILNRNSMQALDVIKDDVPTGTIVTVERASDLTVEGTVLGTVRAFKAPPYKVQKGERVVVDASLQFVIGTLGMPPADFTYSPSVHVTWDDIGGQEDAKAALREAIELPLSHPDLFAAYGKKMSKGVLLSGPPGTGKTLIAKASATAIARAYASSDAGKKSAKAGKIPAGGFIYVKGPEMLASWIGKTEQAVRELFKAAREHKAAHGYPAVVFLDECDALLGGRDRGQHTTINATVVPQFLAEMDGLDDAAAMFILATNRPDMLDPAVVREGRVDRKVRVGRPTAADARAIFQIHLRNRPLLVDGQTLTHKDGEEHWLAVTHMAELAQARLYADDLVVRDYGNGAVIRARDFASGAMIAGAIEQAATLAVVADIAAGRKRAGGIGVAALEEAIDGAARGLRETDHREVMRELAERQGATAE